MIAVAIADKLQSLGLGTVGTDIFDSALPPAPDNCITVIQTAGIESDVDLPLHNPTFQIIIRNASYEDGSDKLSAIREALHQLSNFEQGDLYFYYLLANSYGGSIGKDGQGRDEFSINFRCKVREA